MAKILNNKPAVFEKIKEAFPFVTDDFWKKGVLIAYDGKIYCSKKPSQDSIVHEETHLEQQKRIGGSDIWWEKYLHEKEFRLAQELEAYGRQFRFMDKHYNNKRWIEMAKDFHIKSLCSPQYGEMISVEEAKRILGVE